MPGKLEARARLLANACAAKHFATNDDLPQLQSLLAKYGVSSAAKKPNTVLLALIRSIVSRKIDLELAELGLEEGDLDGIGSK